jgi:CheY-like chemotaxis protein
MNSLSSDTSTSSDYVLVVDDDPDAQEALCLIVETLGVESRVAVDGQQALEVVLQSPPVLVLLDIMMPQLNGLSVVAKMYASPTTRDVPIILVSAAIQNRKNLESLPNVVAVMQKSDFSVSDMMRLVARTLHLESRIPQSEPKPAPRLQSRHW